MFKLLSEIIPTRTDKLWLKLSQYRN